jgi:hypothetical protein
MAKKSPTKTTSAQAPKRIGVSGSFLSGEIDAGATVAATGAGEVSRWTGF